MSNVFRDQQKFMTACDQSVDKFNENQFTMYVKLIDEEHQELLEATLSEDPVEQLDALIDILVVTIGAIHSMGADGEGAWREVMRSNFSKVGEDGKVRKREDGKVLKPINYSPPDLTPFLKK
jgi:predicted HAD superfamily Cof-like phosphohydrolase